MIAAGTSLLHYRIVEKIGEGGMGAIPEAFASLNLPNIAALHGFHEVGPSTGSGPGVGFHSLYAVTPDGQRFLVVTEPEGRASSPITVVLDWAVGLKP